MRIEFTKMHGAGNDYIYLDYTNKKDDFNCQTAITLSDRHKGIGGDGVVLIMKSSIADAKMRMFNMDGSEGKMCGNAIRCVAKFLYEHEIVNKKIITIETLSGIKTLELFVDGNTVKKVKVDMGCPITEPKKIPVLSDKEIIIKDEITVLGKKYYYTAVSMGNPHACVFLDDVASLNLNEIGPKFENNELFPDKINTEFIKVIDNHTLEMRVYERGSGETQACGTGACASVVAAVLNGYVSKNTDVCVRVLGGELTINYTGETVYMTGECVECFKGVVSI